MYSFFALVDNGCNGQAPTDFFPRPMLVQTYHYGAGGSSQECSDVIALVLLIEIYKSLCCGGRWDL